VGPGEGELEGGPIKGKGLPGAPSGEKAQRLKREMPRVFLQMKEKTPGGKQEMEKGN